MQLFLFILVIFSLTLIISFSFSIAFQSGRFFNFALAAIITFAPYLTYLFSFQLQLPIFLSIPLAIGCTVVVGLLSELILFRPLRKRNASHISLMLSSLGLYIVLQNVISLLWGDRALSIRTGEIRAGHEFMGAIISNTQITTIVVCLVLFTACVIFMKYARIGLNIRALECYSELCNIFGVSSDLTFLWATGFGSAFMAVVGILIAYDADMSPVMGFNWLFYGVVAMMIGGVGSNWGLIGGALMLVSAKYITMFYIGSRWMEAIVYILVIIFLIIKPLGFSGKRLKKVEI
jgi:branched-subunit amino acid ABC-type transport system permease component